MMRTYNHIFLVESFYDFIGIPNARTIFFLFHRKLETPISVLTSYVFAA